MVSAGVVCPGDPACRARSTLFDNLHSFFLPLFIFRGALRLSHGTTYLINKPCKEGRLQCSAAGMIPLCRLTPPPRRRSGVLSATSRSTLSLIFCEVLLFAGREPPHYCLLLAAAVRSSCLWSSQLSLAVPQSSDQAHGVTSHVDDYDSLIGDWLLSRPAQQRTATKAGDIDHSPVASYAVRPSCVGEEVCALCQSWLLSRPGWAWLCQLCCNICVGWFLLLASAVSCLLASWSSIAARHLNTCLSSPWWLLSFSHAVPFLSSVDSQIISLWLDTSLLQLHAAHLHRPRWIVTFAPLPTTCYTPPLTQASLVSSGQCAVTSRGTAAVQVVVIYRRAHGRAPVRSIVGAHAQALGFAHTRDAVRTIEYDSV